MSSDPLREHKPTADTQPAAPDERDATIARLERALAQERQNAGTLRTTVDDLRFKIDILEKSYAKQLEDARQRRDTAESELAAERARIAEHGAGGEETVKLLTEVRADLARITAERDDLRSRLTRSEKSEPWRKEPRISTTPAHDQTLTIDDLLATSRWRVERRAAGDGHSNAQVKADQDAPDEMIAPELVFTKGKSEDEA